MSSIEKTKEELQDVEILKSISSALLEISSIRIRELKEEFERNKHIFLEAALSNSMSALAQGLIFWKSPNKFVSSIVSISCSFGPIGLTGIRSITSFEESPDL